jgi:DNA-binding MarR family transcriptional regulator
MVHTMNNLDAQNPDLPLTQKARFSQALDRLYQCCTQRHAYLSEKFGLPQAASRALMLFGAERYLTPKGISGRLGVTKSRVTKIIDGLAAKGFVRKMADPVDSRVTLLALTPAGLKARGAICAAMDSLRDQVLLRIAPDKREAVLDSLETLKSCMEDIAAELA